MIRHYILDENHEIQPATLLEWGRFIQKRESMRVAYSRFECGAWVSTVFLGLDHRFGDKGPPLIFETMVFEMDMHGDGEMHRYSTWDDAVIGHKATVRRVKKQLAKAGLSTMECVEAVR